MDYRDNRQRWAESHQVVHFYAGQWCTFTPALTQEPLSGAFFIACGRSAHSMISTFEEVAVGKKPLDKEIQE